MARHPAPQPELVSVILPVHNGERFLQEAVQSVLRQSYRPLEIIVVDDGSTDGTATVAQSLGSQVRYFHQAQAGPAAARNLALRNARGSLIAFIDADDLWPAEKLAAHVHCLRLDPSAQVVQGLIRRIWIPPLRPPGNAGPEVHSTFIYTNLGSMVMRRSLFETIGNFDEGLRFHEDSDFWLRCREQGVNMLMQRKLSLLYRLHGRNLTTGANLATTRFLNIIRRSMHRRRQGVAGSGPVPRLGPIHEMHKDGSRTPLGQVPDPPEWPLVSIILHGGVEPRERQEALGSIRAQAYEPYELIIIGGLPENTALDGLPAPSRVQTLGLFSDAAQGLNAGIEAAKGEMIGFIDSQEVWAPGKLEAQVAYLAAYPGTAYVTGRSRPVVQPAERYPAALLDSLSTRVGSGGLLGTLLVRRSFFVEMGGFRTGLPAMADADWVLRAADRGFSRSTLTGAVTYRVLRPDSTATDPGQMRAALLASVRASMRRKRRGSPAGPAGEAEKS